MWRTKLINGKIQCEKFNCILPSLPLQPDLLQFNRTHCKGLSSCPRPYHSLSFLPFQRHCSQNSPLHVLYHQFRLPYWILFISKYSVSFPMFKKKIFLDYISSSYGFHQVLERVFYIVRINIRINITYFTSI